MCKFSEEVFLHDYFTFDAVVGKFCNRREIFDCIARIYYVERNQANRLFALATSKKIDNVATFKDYKRYCRLRQYFQTCNLPADTTEEEDDLLTIKGKALRLISECGLDFRNETKASVYTNLVEKANAGQVTALRIYGVLQCEGVFFEKRVSDAIKNLTRAARWNSLEGILALLQYDTNNVALYTNMLNTLATCTPYEEVFSKVKSYYGIKDLKKIDECILLSKVFGRGQVAREVYLPTYANFLYSEIIPFKDKEAILLSEGKDMVSSYIDLPLKLRKYKFSYNVSAITTLSIRREEEQNRMIQNALNSDIRHFPTFKPLCICSDSKYMRNYYSSAIENLFEGAHVERISVADLNLCDFNPDMNNIFIRSCNEDKGNVLILSLVGDLNEQAVKYVCDFLQSDKRRRMHLVRPNVEIDLGSVLPVCMCDKINVQMFSRFCDVLELATPTRDEKRILIKELIVEKENQYSIKKLKVEEDVIEKLCNVGIDVAEMIIDATIIATRRGNCELTINGDHAGKFIAKHESTRGYGYGGYKKW